MTREKDSETERRRGRRRGPRAQKLFSSSFDSHREDTRSDWLARARIRLETRSGHQSLVKPRRLVVEMPTQCPFVDRSAVSLSLVRWPLLHHPVPQRVSLFLLEFRSDQLLALFLFSGYPTAFLCPLDSLEVFSFFFLFLSGESGWILEEKDFRGHFSIRDFRSWSLGFGSGNLESLHCDTFQRLHLRTTGASNPCILKFLSQSLNLWILQSFKHSMFTPYYSSSISSLDLSISGSLNLSIFESLDIWTYKFPDNFHSQKFHAERLQSTCSFFSPQDQDIYESKIIHSFVVYEVRNSAYWEIAEWTRGRYAKVETSGTGSSGQSGRANIASAKG